jgi:hypothetical protein
MRPRKPLILCLVSPMEDRVQSESEVPPRDARQKRWLARWIETRRRGRLAYVVRRGILVYGVIFAVWMIAARAFGIFGEREPWSMPRLLFSFAFYAVFFGVWMGLWTWHLHEKRFREASDARCR